MDYILNDHGEVVETSLSFTNGRWRMIDGKLVRVGDGSRGPIHYAGTDDLGVQGVLNPANGKRYDSRSAYMQSVKDAGCVIVGNDAPTHAPKQKPINWEKAVAQTLKSTPRKGKK